MPLHTRQQLVNLARKYDALVVTDDVYDFLQWDVNEKRTIDPSNMKAPFQRLSDIDRVLPQHLNDPDHFGYTMSNGSFSKICAPGTRTGWADCMPKMAYGLSQCGSTKSGGSASQLTATYINYMLETGTLRKHIALKLIPGYQSRYRTLRAAIRQYLEPYGVQCLNAPDTGTFGGYFVWIKLPDYLKAKNVVAHAKENMQLTVSQAEAFEVVGDKNPDFSQCIRLCFAWEPEDLLVEAVARLAETIRASRSQCLAGVAVSQKGLSMGGI